MCFERGKQRHLSEGADSLTQETESASVCVFWVRVCVVSCPKQLHQKFCSCRVCQLWLCFGWLAGWLPAECLRVPSVASALDRNRLMCLPIVQPSSVVTSTCCYMWLTPSSLPLDNSPGTFTNHTHKRHARLYIQPKTQHYTLYTFDLVLWFSALEATAQAGCIKLVRHNSTKHVPQRGVSRLKVSQLACSSGQRVEKSTTAAEANTGGNTGSTTNYAQIHEPPPHHTTQHGHSLLCAKGCKQPTTLLTCGKQLHRCCQLLPLLQQTLPASKQHAAFLLQQLQCGAAALAVGGDGGICIWVHIHNLLCVRNRNKRWHT